MANPALSYENEMKDLLPRIQFEILHRKILGADPQWLEMGSENEKLNMDKALKVIAHSLGIPYFMDK